MALATLGLTACAGSLPLSESFSVIDAEASELEFTAPVDGIGPEAWSIGGLAVTVGAGTEIVGEPQVGDLVRVHAQLALGGLTAREIEVVSPAAQDGGLVTPLPGDEIEFIGPVVSIGDTAWTVGDQTVAVTSETEIKDAIIVGDMVKVHASTSADLSLTAREIELAKPEDLAGAEADDDEDDLEFKGLLESIDGQTWIVAGLAFQVLPGADIRDTLVVGDFIEIHAVWSEEGVLTALRIELAQDDDGGSDDDLEEGDDDVDDEDDDHDEDDDGESEDDDSGNSGSGSSGSG
jgi:hypothetical protein